MVDVLALYSDDLNSNPAEANSFSVKIVLEKNENKQKEAGVGHLNKTLRLRFRLFVRPKNA